MVDERVFMSLGILKVAAVLEQEGYVVEVLDLSGIDNYLDVVKEYFNDSDSKIIGITATSPQIMAVEKISQVIPDDVKVILGGPHATLTVSSKKREDKLNIKGRTQKPYDDLFKMADVVVSGDGELAIFEAIKAESGVLIDADDSTSSLWIKKEKLGELPFPARHLVDIKSYNYKIAGRNATSLIAQLGCPFGCIFCGGRFSPCFRSARQRSHKSIIAEMEHLYMEYGFTGFMFYDDELNVNPELNNLLEDIIKLQVKLNDSFRLRGFLKSQLVTEKQADLMYQAGFRQILVGFESGNERILKNIQKNATVEQNIRCMEICHKYNLEVKALMSLGNAGESEETIKDTKEWLLAVKPADFDCTIVSTYPGTPYYDEAKLTSPDVWTYVSPISGDKLHSYSLDFVTDSNYYKGIPGEGYKSYVFTDYVSADRLVELRDNLEFDVRTKLHIPFYQVSVAKKFEHSMGQIPPNILRRTK